MNEIIINDRKFSAPSRWDEVNEKQFIAWAAASLKNMTLANNIRLLIKIYYRIPLVFFLALPESVRIQIAPTLSFLYDGKLPVQWLIKKLRVRWFTVLHGPADRLANCTINEFRYALMYYQAYHKAKEGKEDYLDQLIATLYRPKRKGPINHDIRADLTDHGISQRAPLMRSLSKKMRHAILLNFEGCYALIRSRYLDKLPKSGEAGEGLFDFNGVILTVSGGKFGPKSQTEQAMLYDFLEHLVQTAEEVERLKKK